MYFETGRASAEYDFDKEGGKNLQKCIDGNFYYGLQNLAKQNKRFDMPKRKWVNGDVFHYASIDGRLNPLFRALEGKDIVLVGPSFLRRVQGLKWKRSIPVPRRNCFKSKDTIKQSLLECEVEGVYIFCCCYLANILIYEMNKPNSIMIDLGSLLDIYAGKPSRGYQKKISKETFIRNLCG